MPETGGEIENQEPQKPANQPAFKAIFVSLVFCVIGLFLIVIIITMGFELSNKQPAKEEPEITRSAEMVQVQYNHHEYSYNLKPEIMRGDDSFILSKIGQTRGKVAIIRSQEKLNELLIYLDQYDNEDARQSLDHDISFFRSGSIIAIALENGEFSEADEPYDYVKNLYRDEYYDLHLSLDSKLHGDNSQNSRLILLEVENIQPQTVYLELK